MTLLVVKFTTLFTIAMSVSYFITPLIKKIALYTGYVDKPANHKAHKKVTPLLGGMAISSAFYTSVIIFCPFTEPVKGILIAGFLLQIVGLIDDKYGMEPKSKLFWQATAAAILISYGVKIEIIEARWLSTPLTIFWIIGITNAMNLLDNMDGLTAGVTAICSIILFFISGFTLNPAMAVLSLALAGASLGFLRHNFPPAKIFMGDCGSLFIGFILASLAILGTWRDAATLVVSLGIPILVLGVPIFDTTLVTITRLLNGKPVSQGGKDHSSHRLMNIGLSPKQVALTIYFAALVLGSSAIYMLESTPTRMIFIFIAIIVMAFAIGVRLGRVDVGYHEATEKDISKTQKTRDKK